MKIIILVVILLLLTIIFTAFGERSETYKDGYNDGYDNKRPAEPLDIDYMDGWEDGSIDEITNTPNRYPPDDDAPADDERGRGRPPVEPPKEAHSHPFNSDPDSDGKGGGGDPIVLEDWYYTENAGAKCATQYKFDYDNDSFKENFCYIINGAIFVIDFNGDGKITKGYEMLNFINTNLQYYNPVYYLTANPDICNQYSCYLWNDYNHNWITDDKELSEFTLKIDKTIVYKEGKKHTNGSFIYCYGKTVEGFKFYCLQPTYWMKGI